MLQNMRVLLVAAVVAAADRSDVNTAAPQGCSLVPTLLHAAGFSPTCVAASLAGCQATEGRSTLVQDVADAVGGLREAVVEVQGVLQDMAQLRRRPRNCRDLQAAGDEGVGLREVFPYRDAPEVAATVLCDQATDGGGWTVIQHRFNATAPREDFFRTWVEYQLGFGQMDGEFWLGLDLIHTLSSQQLQQLRVDLSDYRGNQTWAKYDLFNVAHKDYKYILAIGRYTGTAGDGLGGHSGHPFSTHDADHDTSADANCAQAYKGGWWYTSCHSSNLNGHPYTGDHESYADGINWQPWLGYHYSLRTATMMIRPAFYTKP